MSINKQRGHYTIILIFSAAGCSSPGSAEAEVTPTPYPTAVIPTKPTYTVERGEVVEELQFSARVAPVVQEELFFRTDGRVRCVYADDGDSFEEGQIVISP